MLFFFVLLIVFSESDVLGQDTELVVYAQPIDLTSWLDHTGVYTGDGDKYVFACSGNLPIKDEIRYSMSARGDLKRAITIASGDINAHRENNIFDTKDDYCGITYGVHGVCHQMVNRILYTAGVAMDKSQLYGGSLSYTLYGVYGHGWDSYLKKCEKQWNNTTRLALREKIISNSKGVMKEYLEIEFSNNTDVVKITKRIDLLLKYQYNRNMRIDKKALYQAGTDFVNNLHKSNDTKHAEDEFRRFNERAKDVLGNEGYKQLFGIEYNLKRLTFQKK